MMHKKRQSEIERRKKHKEHLIIDKEYDRLLDKYETEILEENNFRNYFDPLYSKVIFSCDMYHGDGYQECFNCKRACIYIDLNDQEIYKWPYFSRYYTKKNIIDYNKNMYFGCKYCTCKICSYPLDIKLYFDYDGVYKRTIICQTCNKYKEFFKEKIALKSVNKQFNKLLNDKYLNNSQNDLLNGINISNFINIIKLIKSSNLIN